MYLESVECGMWMFDVGAKISKSVWYAPSAKLALRCNENDDERNKMRILFDIYNQICCLSPYWIGGSKDNNVLENGNVDYIKWDLLSIYYVFTNRFLFSHFSLLKMTCIPFEWMFLNCHNSFEAL